MKFVFFLIELNEMWQNIIRIISVVGVQIRYSGVSEVRCNMWVNVFKLQNSYQFFDFQ